MKLYRFFYTFSRPGDNPREFTGSQLFDSAETLENRLREWSGDGWEYSVTDQQRAFNAEAPPERMDWGRKYCPVLGQTARLKNGQEMEVMECDDFRLKRPVRVIFTDGNEIVTWMNGTRREILGHYMNMVLENGARMTGLRFLPLFQPGDKVTFVNDYGVRFPGRTVTALNTTTWPVTYDGYRYDLTPWQTPWSPAHEHNLVLEKEPVTA